MQFFEKSSHIVERASSDVGWMNRLRNAVDADSFELRFQPINQIDSGATRHHEVLLRKRRRQIVEPRRVSAVRRSVRPDVGNRLVDHPALG